MFLHVFVFLHVNLFPSFLFLPVFLFCSFSYSSPCSSGESLLLFPKSSSMHAGVTLFGKEFLLSLTGVLESWVFRGWNADCKLELRDFLFPCSSLKFQITLRFFVLLSQFSLSFPFLHPQFFIRSPTRVSTKSPSSSPTLSLLSLKNLFFELIFVPRVREKGASTVPAPPYSTRLTYGTVGGQQTPGGSVCDTW